MTMKVPKIVEVPPHPGDSIPLNSSLKASHAPAHILRCVNPRSAQRAVRSLTSHSRCVVAPLRCCALSSRAAPLFQVSVLERGSGVRVDQRPSSESIAVPLRVCAPGTQVRSELSPQADISGSSPGGRTPSIELGATPLAINSRLDSTTISNLSRLNPRTRLFGEVPRLLFNSSVSRPLYSWLPQPSNSSLVTCLPSHHRCTQAVLFLFSEFFWVLQKRSANSKSHKGSSFLPFSSSSHPSSSVYYSPQSLHHYQLSLDRPFLHYDAKLSSNPSPYPRSYDATQAIPSGMRSPVYSPRSQWLRGHETIHLRRGALPGVPTFASSKPSSILRWRIRILPNYHEATRFPPGLTPILNAATPNLLSPIHSPTYENRAYKLEQTTMLNLVLMANRAVLQYPEQPPPAPHGGPDLPSPDNLVWPIDVDGPPEYDHGIEDG
ncbi:hypothetical protein H4Q26_016069 [Puccinia striiformis f. sp. tritici PST-130]|nr:hypothetical protein H4Q26_016069 [Puccinia striiformis f. sp. tritici PST-130]